MDPATIQIIHYVITALTTLSTIILTYLFSQKDKKNDDDKINEKRMSQLELEMAVVRTQIENDKESRIRLYNKLDDIQVQLNDF